MGPSWGSAGEAWGGPCPGLGGWGPGCEARAGQWEQSSLHLRELCGCFLLYVEVGLQAGPAHLLSDPAHPQLPLEEESEEEEMEEEDSSFKLCVPVTFQSPLHKTFRPIDTVGKWGAPTSSPNTPQAAPFSMGSWVRYQFLPPGGTIGHKMTTRDVGQRVAGREASPLGRVLLPRGVREAR